jgi:TatD DNase family protein
MLVDSHAHLDFEEYGSELADVATRARDAGIVHIVLVGQYREQGGIAAAGEALKLSRTDPELYSATAGIHPHEAAHATDADLAALERLCADPDIFAVGECGLDYHYDRAPRDVQRERFAAQVRLARKLGKPVVVHTREADEDTAAILEREMGKDGGIIHCFTGDWAAAQRYLALGLNISLSGVLTFKSAEALREAAARIPLERLLVETDSPYLAPVPYRGRRNEPAYAVRTAAALAAVRGIPLAHVERATTENARRVLRLRFRL